jgi:CubicO group peptidase (beta-lactamase class C family)
MIKKSASFLRKTLALLFFIFFTNAHAEPNKELYGSKANYPLVKNIFNSELDPYVIAEYSGQRFEKENLHPNFDEEIHWVRKFVKVQEFPSETVKWPSGKNPEKWVEKFPILSIVVYKDGKIIFEKYQYDRKPTQRYNSQSMAKTLTAMAVGIAVSEKLIDIEKPASYYIKELEGCRLALHLNGMPKVMPELIF